MTLNVRVGVHVDETRHGDHCQRLVSCTLYAPPRDATHLDLVENVAALVGVSLFIPEPELTGQPLPILWGPWGEGQTGTRLFAVGDPNNPGFLYWTNPDDPDSVSDTRGSLEITSPSEPLVSGCLFDGVPVVASGQALVAHTPDRQP